MKWNVERTFELTEPTVALQVLRDRGVDPETFFQLGADTLHDPFLLKDMDRATIRAKQAIDNGERILVAGDYDSDGITSTYTIMDTLRRLKADAMYAIPNRKNGYGLSVEMVDRAYRDGCTLIITCDNGIACIDQVEHAKTLGIDVIITDHHEPQETIPDTIVVNPKRKDCPYPFKELAGCAVAWKFCHALLSYYEMQDQAFSLMEMVATGTIADMMELTGENRAIVAMGLRSYDNPVNDGLHRLMQEMDLYKYPVTTDTIGFSIGPALNAAGRLSNAEQAVDLFYTHSPIQEKRLASYIKELNDERKEWTEAFAVQALDELKGNTDKVIVHQMDGIPEGIVGIIASRILNATGRPILLMTPDATGKYYKGSGRSVPGFDLFEEMSKNKELLAKFGGHEGACGFSLEAKHVDALRERLNSQCTLTEEDLVPVTNIDYEIEAHELSVKLAEDLQQLEPTGRGFQQPVFMVSDCLVSKANFIGGNKKTLKLTLISGTTTLNAIGFNMADAYQEIEAVNGQEQLYLDIAFTPSVNEWQGRKSFQAKLKAIRPSGQE